MKYQRAELAAGMRVWRGCANIVRKLSYMHNVCRCFCDHFLFCSIMEACQNGMLLCSQNCPAATYLEQKWQRPVLSGAQRTALTSLQSFPRGIRKCNHECPLANLCLTKVPAANHVYASISNWAYEAKPLVLNWHLITWEDLLDAISVCTNKRIISVQWYQKSFHLILF